MVTLVPCQVPGTALSYYLLKVSSTPSWAMTSRVHWAILQHSLGQGVQTLPALTTYFQENLDNIGVVWKCDETVASITKYGSKSLCFSDSFVILADTRIIFSISIGILVIGRHWLSNVLSSDSVQWHWDFLPCEPVLLVVMPMSDTAGEERLWSPACGCSHCAALLFVLGQNSVEGSFFVVFCWRIYSLTLHVHLG